MAAAMATAGLKAVVAILQQPSCTGLRPVDSDVGHPEAAGHLFVLDRAGIVGAEWPPPGSVRHQLLRATSHFTVIGAKE